LKKKEVLKMMTEEIEAVEIVPEIDLLTERGREVFEIGIEKENEREKENANAKESEKENGNEREIEKEIEIEDLRPEMLIMIATATVRPLRTKKKLMNEDVLKDNSEKKRPHIRED